MASSSKTQPASVHKLNATSEMGIIMILAGVLLLVEQLLHTGWLVPIIPALAGLVLLGRGIVRRQAGFLISGTILFGSGAAVFSLFSPWFQADFQVRLAAFFFILATGWGLVFLTSALSEGKYRIWTLIPALAAIGEAAWLLVTPFSPLGLVLSVSLCIGLTLLACGLLTRLIGLVIPGCLLATMGPGVYFAWGVAGLPNSLAQTGLMLVTFALGWGLITVFSRLMINRFIWWPLIPGGVLAMVGCGLYIGGDPSNALSFIGNTSSIGLIIFGIYLLLWRSELRQ